jgi:uncharacterized membrane protein YoaK (UPF0700 family)
VRPAERDSLLLVLSAAAGSADAWSYFGIGHSFVANMTGNTVLIGVALVHLNGDFLHPLLSLAGYAVGVIAGALLTRKVNPQTFWPRAVSRTIFIEALLLCLAEILWSLRIHASSSVSPGRDGLLALVAFAIGTQSGAMLQMKIPGVVTTYITGTWTNLMSSVARLFSRGRKTAKGGILSFEERLMLQAGVLSVYLLSAVLTGLLLRFIPTAAGALPAAAVSFTAIYGVVRN